MAPNHVFQRCPLDEHLIEIGRNYGRVHYINILESNRNSRKVLDSSAPTPALSTISRSSSPIAWPTSATSQPLSRQKPKSSAQSSHPPSPVFTATSAGSTPWTPPQTSPKPTPKGRSPRGAGWPGALPSCHFNTLPIMLNVRALSELLKANEHERLWPKIFLMSPNGSLVAYSQPSNTKNLRDEAALISLAWKDHDASTRDQGSRPDTARSTASSVISAGSLETLTIEKEDMNIFVRAVQPKLLLVMRGGVPPGRKGSFKMTPELCGSPRYPSGDPVLVVPTSAKASPSSSPGKLSTSQSSTLSQRDRDIQGGVLHIQRKKLDALTKAVREEFDTKGFIMPDDTALQ